VPVNDLPARLRAAQFAIQPLELCAGQSRRAKREELDRPGGERIIEGRHSPGLAPCRVQDLGRRAIGEAPVMIARDGVDGDAQTVVLLNPGNYPARIVEARHTLRQDVIADRDAEVEAPLTVRGKGCCRGALHVLPSGAEIAERQHTDGLAGSNGFEHRRRFLQEGRQDRSMSGAHPALVLRSQTLQGLRIALAAGQGEPFLK